ncbi:MAG: rod shape-determining protein MreC [Bacteroides sp.]|nr:rod shape-determining protein MreC [Bacteroides sp.]MCM1413124.1 rod shape-determining protein MreC [Bacteroides sp.]MCM1472134.1 rod shape-determining protein MreC [Bacteroides sp.]
MDNLIYFLLKWRPWMLFAVYIIISCVMLFGTNPYQQSVYLTSANNVSSGLYNMSNSVTGYFNLHDINEDLQRRNAELELEIIALKDKLLKYRELYASTHLDVDSAFRRYDFIVAHVINNNVTRPHNFITINKGSLDGVKPDMGVVDQNGVVGKVNVVGPHASRIISLLNEDLRISCKIKSTQQVGSLIWDGKDSRYALLRELPRHATFHKGDTIVTSGYSTTFPEGVPIGIIDREMKEVDDNFFTLKIKLFTDFSQLSTVRVVIDNMTDELKMVEADPAEETTNPNSQQ